MRQAGAGHRRDALALGRPGAAVRVADRPRNGRVRDHRRDVGIGLQPRFLARRDRGRDRVHQPVAGDVRGMYLLQLAEEWLLACGDRSRPGRHGRRPDPRHGGLVLHEDNDVLIHLHRQLRCLRGRQCLLMVGPLRRSGRSQGSGCLSQHERRCGARNEQYRMRSGLMMSCWPMSQPHALPPRADGNLAA